MSFIRVKSAHPYQNVNRECEWFMHLFAEVELECFDGAVFSGSVEVDYDATLEEHLAFEADFIDEALTHVAETTGIDPQELELDGCGPLGIRHEIARTGWVPAYCGDLAHRRCDGLAINFGVMAWPDGGEVIIETPGESAPNHRALDARDAWRAAHVISRQLTPPESRRAQGNNGRDADATG